MPNLMTRHPNAVGESYAEHFATAWSFAAALLAVSLVCLVHGLLPFLFQSTASREIDRLHQRMSHRAVRRPRAPRVDAPA